MTEKCERTVTKKVGGRFSHVSFSSIVLLKLGNCGYSLVFLKNGSQPDLGLLQHFLLSEGQ